MSGIRDNKGKARMSLLPFDALRELAGLFTWGASKYGAWNWSKGLSWSETMDSLMRHQERWLARDEVDESGYHHDVHILWNAVVLVAMRLRGIGKDDRHTQTKSDSVSDGSTHVPERDVSNPTSPVTTSHDPTLVIPIDNVPDVMGPYDDDPNFRDGWAAEGSPVPSYVKGST